jgi:hypothetical protein
MPPWAQKVDDIGTRYWGRKKPVRNRRPEYIWGVIWNLIFLWLVNKVPDWNLGFINSHYSTLLPLLSLNLLLQAGANLILVFFGAPWVRNLLKIVMDAANFVVAILIYFIYPFDFARVGFGWVDIVIPIVLILVMAVSALSVLVHLIKLIFARS